MWGKIDYIEQYSAPFFYKQRVRCQFRKWLDNIREKYEIKEGDKKKYYSTVNTVHPIVLQENIMELGTLIEALSYNYFKNESNISVIIAIDIWSQMSDYARDRTKRYYTIRDKDVIEFIDILEDEFPDNHINNFCTEREMYENNLDMSNREILTYAIKVPGRICTLEIEDEQGKTKVLNKQFIQ